MAALRTKPFPASLWLLVLLIAALLPAGCAHPSASKPPTGGAAYEARGTIREISLDRRTALIRHEAIRGYMPAMTMELSVLDPKEFENINPGDEIDFRLVVTEESHWIDQVRARKTSAHPVAPAPAGNPLGDTRPVRPGALVPDFGLTSETGGKLRLSDFRGQVVALTFIFTRCPLPDFCPRMSKGFAQAGSLLNSEGAPKSWQLLSISFDPEFDTPKVLSNYAKLYRGSDTTNWLFAAADPANLGALSASLDLVLTRNGGSISHNLRTVVIDPKGRLYRRFDGNAWSASELVEAMKMAGQTTAE